MVKKIKEAFKVKQEREWEKTYFMFDIHGTILKPSYHNEEKYEFYSYAKEALQIITNHPEIVNILWSCTSDDNLKKYDQFFKNNNINFNYINENPEIVNNELSSFDKKLYCSVGFDDKFGFDPENDWYDILQYFQSLDYEKYTLDDLKEMYENGYYQLHDDTNEFIYIKNILHFSGKIQRKNIVVAEYLSVQFSSYHNTDGECSHSRFEINLKDLIPISKEEFETKYKTIIEPFNNLLK